MSAVDPSSMTEGERFEEIAETLARGLQRYFAVEIKRRSGTQISRDQLDAVAAAEAACGSDVLNPKSQEPAS